MKPVIRSALPPLERIQGHTHSIFGISQSQYLVNFFSVVYTAKTQKLFFPTDFWELGCESVVKCLLQGRAFNVLCLCYMEQSNIKIKCIVSSLQNKELTMASP